jgi:3-oxoacyl-[acyl-carrier-protein] synthase II
MSRHDRRVVVTGLGTVNPLGSDVESSWAAARRGDSGIGPITAFDASNTATKIAAEIEGFDPLDYLEKREARRLDRYTQFFVAATSQALSDAGLDYLSDDEAATGAGAIVGAGLGGMHSFIEGLDTLRERGPSRVNPLTITKLIPNMAAGYASIAFNLQGPSNCTVTACAASANAIGDAAEMIRRGIVDVMVAGGSEAVIVEFAVAAFNSSKALSTRNDEPTRASRPFDAGRDGFVMGEGAATLILEEREHAVARGATIYTEVTGYGLSSDAYHVTLPRPGGAGQARAMAMALKDAGLEGTDIDYINAHGTSTPANDRTETAAIKVALGEEAAQGVAISSTKSMTGHLLGGAGAVEAMLSVLAIRDGVAPPTINYEDPDPDCDLDYIPNVERPMEIRHTMSNSFGFGGHNVALIFSAPNA